MLGNWKLITHISSILYYIIQTVKTCKSQMTNLPTKIYIIYKLNHKKYLFDIFAFL